MVARRPTLVLLVACAALVCAAVGARAAEIPARPDFAKHVRPLLAKYCTTCHSGEKPKGDLRLDDYEDQAKAVADRKVWEHVAEKIQSGEMPPDDKPQPSDAEKATLSSWIDTAVLGIDCNGPKDPGRVTIRRLNRAEYNATIRDLVGIDFQPADDFPADDIGYGFDNIGDVLSMPPILLEKYLAAAEKIVDRAIVTSQTGGVFAHVKGDALEVRGDGGGGVVNEHMRSLASSGKLRANVQFPANGEYHIRARAYGEQAGSQVVKISLRIEGRDVARFDVPAVEADPQVYEAKVRVSPGLKRFEVAFLNDFYNPNDPDPKNRDRNLVVDYLEVAGPLAAELPPSHRRIIPREPTPEDKPQLTREILGNFAAKAYRRPVSKEEVKRLAKFVELAEKDGESFAAGIKLAVQAILVSPHFLFRIEMDPEPNDPQAVRVLNEFELATRLSYFLWSSMPDEALFAQAQAGTLRANLQGEVKRMLADPKSQALVENFAGQWLQLRSLKLVTRDAQLFPNFDDNLRNAMRKETEMFFAAVMREDRSVLDFLDADFTFLNERLAKHYGIDGVQGEEFRRVSLSGDQRGGVLTQASVLTVTSHPTRTSPVKRGKWILENFLGAAPPPPPPNVPELDEKPEAIVSGSLRQRFEQHRSKAECASCHRSMDPLGFGLENYDALGAWRTQDGKFPIDPAGELPGGQSFKNSRELKGILKARQHEFTRCLAEKLLTFGLGRGLEYYDKCTVAEIVAAAERDGHKFSSLVHAVVLSEPFQKRRGKGVER